MAKEGRYRKVSSRIWCDEEFRGLSHAGKVAWFYLLTCPQMTSLGAMMHTVPGIAGELGMGIDDLREALRVPLETGMVRIDERAALVVLPNFIAHNPPENPNVVKSWDAIIHEQLTECAMLREYLGEVEAVVWERGEALGKALGPAFAAARHGKGKERKGKSNTKGTKGGHEGHEEEGGKEEGEEEREEKTKRKRISHGGTGGTGGGEDLPQRHRGTGERGEGEAKKEERMEEGTEEGGGRGKEEGKREWGNLRQDAGGTDEGMGEAEKGKGIGKGLPKGIAKGMAIPTTHYPLPINSNLDLHANSNSNGKATRGRRGVVSAGELAVGLLAIGELKSIEEEEASRARKLVKLGRYPASWEPWWREVLQMARGTPALGRIEEAARYVADCSRPEVRRVKDLGELQNPGGYLFGEATKALKAAGVRKWSRAPARV